MTASTIRRVPWLPEPLSFAARAERRSAGRPAASTGETTSRFRGAREYGFALGCVVAVTAIRSLLDSVLAGVSPLLIFVLPTVIMVMRHAPAAAVFATMTSMAVAVPLFVAVPDPAWWSHPAQLTRLGLFLAENATIIAVGYVLQRYRERELEATLAAERLRVVRVTMRSVDHVVNNSLNQLQALRLDAEGYVPAESLLTFDATIKETVTQLTALGNLKVYAEKRSAVGIILDEDTSDSFKPSAT